MNAEIIFIKYDRAFEGKFGTLHKYLVEYQVEGVNKTGEYISKSPEQKTFEEGKTYDIMEEEKHYQGTVYWKIKPAQDRQGHSAYSRKMKSNQAQYSSFAVAYCKDLIIADKLEIGQWETAAEKIAAAMLRIDKKLADGNI